MSRAEGRRVLITGGAGFIGCALASTLARQEDVVLIVLLDQLSDFPYSRSLKEQRMADAFGLTLPLGLVERVSPSDDSAGIVFLQGGASDQSLVARILREHCVCTVIHLAAQPSVREVGNSEGRWRSNVETLLSVCGAISAEAAAATGGGATSAVRQLIFFSSSSVYGTAPLSESGWHEALPTAPQSAYALSKSAGETFLCQWSNSQSSSAVRCTILRPFSVYGEACRPDMAPLAFFDAAFRGQAITLAQSADGSPILRDFTYVGDVVKAVLAIISAAAVEEAPAVTTYNIGRAQPASLDDLLSSVHRALSSRTFAVTRFNKPSEDVPITFADISRAQAELSWNPSVDLDTGIGRMAKWYCDTFDRRAPLFTVALVTTCGRPVLLRRALGSIAAQERQADVLVVVVDTNEGALASVFNDAQIAVAEFTWPQCAHPPCVIVNKRSRGACGAWNTGIIEAAKLAPPGLGWTRVFVSVLDDDDEWTPVHIAECTQAASSTGAQLVVPGILRKSGPADKGRPQAIMTAEQLTRATFYAGNPHLQGSNLFASLSLLARAGLFCEALPSTTDRDLVARISALPPHEVGLVPLPSTWSTICYADATQTDRLSTPGNVRKRAGLAAFLSIHGPAMTAQQRRGFLARARDIFLIDDLVEASGATPTVCPPPTSTSAGCAALGYVSPAAAPTTTPFPLVVGIISDSTDGVTIRPLLRDLARLQAEAGEPNVLVWVIVLENGRAINAMGCSEAQTRSLLDVAVAAEAAAGGLLAAVITAADALADTAAELLPPLDESTRSALLCGKRLPIASARTLLQRYALCMAKGLQQRSRSGDGTSGASRALDPVVWILDDDKGLDPLGSAGQQAGRHAAELEPQWAGKRLLRRALEVHRDTRAGIVLGVDTEAPPLPALSSLRLQLVDVQAVLLAAAAAAAEGGGLEAPLTPCAAVRQGSCITPSSCGLDGYYDLSTARSDHLEVPMCPVCLVASGCWGFCKAPPGAPTAGDALHLLQTFVLPQIAAGAMATRPLVAPMTSTPLASVHRGGCTFIFDLDTLLVPNLAPSYGGRATRRSDMIFCIINSARGSVLVPDLAVRHRRVGRDESRSNASTIASTLADDISGHAVYAALQGALRKRTVTAVGSAPSSFIFSAEEEEALHAGVQHHLEARALQARFSLGRIHGLLSAASLATEENSFAGEALICGLRSGIACIRTAFDIDSLWPSEPSPWGETLMPPLERSLKPLRQVLREDSGVTRQWLCSFSAAAQWAGPTAAASTAIADRLRSRAAAAVLAGRLHFGLAEMDTIHFIGCGSEGVTFRVPASQLDFKTDFTVSGSASGNVAVKVMDVYRLRSSPLAWPALLETVSSWHLDSSASEGFLPQVTGVESASVGPGPGIGILVRRWIVGEQYSGGLEVQLVRAFQELDTVGIALGDFKPDNVLVEARDGNFCLALVDVGLDTLPISPVDRRCAALRAFLCWRWARTLTASEMLKILEAARPALALAAQGMHTLDVLLPESVGFAAFEYSLSPEGVKESTFELGLAHYAAHARGTTSSASPRSFLDFGCGSGGILRHLADIMHPTPALAGYDIDTSMALTCGNLPSVAFTSIRSDVLTSARVRGGFDVVICSRVLCNLPPDSEAEAALLADLRFCIASDGVALIVVRHPTLLAPAPLYFQRPLHILKRSLRRAGLEPLQIQPQHALPMCTDVSSFLPASEYLLLSCVPSDPSLLSLPFAIHEHPPARTALLICATDTHCLTQRVKHIVSTLEGPHTFNGIFLALPAETDFPLSSKTELGTSISELLSQRFIDKVVSADAPGDSMAHNLYLRWFVTPTLGENPANLSTLRAFELISERGDVDLVLLVNSDAMVRRGDSERGIKVPFIPRAHSLFQRDNAAITLALPGMPRLPPYALAEPFTHFDASGEAWKVNSRCCFLHLPRLLQARPLPGGVRLWSQALDEVVATGHFHSVRGGDAYAAAVAFPPSHRKDGGLLLDYIERGGPLPPAMAGSHETPASGFAACARAAGSAVAGSAPAASSWARPEQYVFVVTGRCVSLALAQRCLDSICAQKVPPGVTVGLVVVWDDPSEEAHCASIPSWDDMGAQLACLVAALPGSYAGHSTLLMPRDQCGGLGSVSAAFTSVVTDPTSVIISLDLRGCLIGCDVLGTVHTAFATHGVDLFVGDALRGAGDSSPFLPRSGAADASLNRPLLAARVGALRMLRSTDLGLTGNLAPAAHDAGAVLQLPLSEMAARAATPLRAVYLREPSAVCDCAACLGRSEAESASLFNLFTAAALSPPLSCRRLRAAVVGNASFESSPAGAALSTAAEAAGYALASAGYVVVTGGLGGAMEAACRGAVRAAAAHAGATPAPISSSGGVNVWTRGPPPQGPLAVLPGPDHEPNPFAASVVHTGIGHARNNIVATSADAMIIVGGGSGTLAEAAAAWTAGRLIVALCGTGGTADLLAGRRLDSRRRLQSASAPPVEQDIIHPAHDVTHAVTIINSLIHWHRAEGLRRGAAGAQGAMSAGIW